MRRDALFAVRGPAARHLDCVCKQAAIERAGELGRVGQVGEVCLGAPFDGLLFLPLPSGFVSSSSDKLIAMYGIRFEQDSWTY